MIKIIILTFLVFVDLSYSLKGKNTFYSSNFTNADIIGYGKGAVETAPLTILQKPIEFPTVSLIKLSGMRLKA